MSVSFDNIIGQEGAKLKLGFFLKNYYRSGIIPPLLFTGPKGDGKTVLSESFSSKLITPSNPTKIKPLTIINCGGVKSFFQLMTQILQPKIENEVTLFFDEAAELPKDMMREELLTILNPNKEHKNRLLFNGKDYVFDLRKITWIFATSEPQKLFAAFLNRLERVDLEGYTREQLGKILLKYITPNQIHDEALEDISDCFRGNARQSFQIAMSIKLYMDSHDRRILSLKEWNEIKTQLFILPLGLLPSEVKILGILEAGTGVSLTTLAAKTGQTMTAVQRDAEIYLLKNDLMKIEKANGRIITENGRLILDRIKETYPRLLSK